jgi:ATP-dependent Clp protease ATP-binding subunit ClpA
MTHPLDDLLARAAALHDPAEGLDGVRALREHLDRLEALHVENALRAGWSWRQVAEGLGLSKQAAHRKYAALMRERLAATANGAAAAPVTAATRLAVALGRQEAEALRRDAVGTEHVLLGITRLGTGPAAEALAAAGVTPERAREAVVSLNGDGEAGAATGGGRLGPTPRCRAALERAARLARERGAPRLGPEHLLGALAADPDCGAAQALKSLRAQVPSGAPR